MSELDERDTVSKLNSETSKISWLELQKSYAQGLVVAVAKEMDLINVAVDFSRDNSESVKQWMAEKSVFLVDDQLAEQWLEREATLWAVVVAPWVLVQEPKEQ